MELFIFGVGRGTLISTVVVKVVDVGADLTEWMPFAKFGDNAGCLIKSRSFSCGENGLGFASMSHNTGSLSHIKLFDVETVGRVLNETLV